MNFIQKIFTNSFLKDNMLLFIGTFILGLCGYFFHFYIGRALGPADYGVVGALLSLEYIFNVGVMVAQTSITKFTASLKGKEALGKIRFLYQKSSKKLFIASIVTFIVYLAISPLVKNFLHIESYWPIWIIGTLIVFMALISVARGIIQGLQDFKNLSFNYILEGVSKLGFVILLVALGFGVNGAVGAMVIAIIIPLLIAYYPLKKLKQAQPEPFQTKQVYTYALPVLLTLLTLTFIYTIDLLLVKHFFDPVQAGYYAAIALLGKVLFFGSISISMVMFPKTSELHGKNEPSKHVMYHSLGLVALFTLAVTAFYFIFPRFTATTLFGEQYIAITPFIGWYALFMTFFCLIYLLAFYNLSIKKSSFIYLLFAYNIIELLLILFMHDSIQQVITLLVVSSAVLLAILMIMTGVTHDRTIYHHSSKE